MMYTRVSQSGGQWCLVCAFHFGCFKGSSCYHALPSSDDIEKVCKCDDWLSWTFVGQQVSLCIWGRAYCFVLPVVSYVTVFKKNLSYAGIIIPMSFCPYFFLSVLKWEQMLFCFSSRLSIEWSLVPLENRVSSDSFYLEPVRITQ